MSPEGGKGKDGKSGNGGPCTLETMVPKIVRSVVVVAACMLWNVDDACKRSLASVYFFFFNSMAWTAPG